MIDSEWKERKMYELNVIGPEKSSKWKIAWTFIWLNFKKALLFPFLEGSTCSRFLEFFQTIDLFYLCFEKKIQVFKNIYVLRCFPFQYPT